MPMSPVLGGYYSAQEYLMLIVGHPVEEQLDTWQRGVNIEDGNHTALARVRLEKSKGQRARLRIFMREGH